MCGRYSNALPSYQYIATLEEQMRRDEDNRRKTSHQKEGESSKSGSQGASRGAKDADSTNDAEIPPINSVVEEQDYYPTHNVAPSSRMPIVRLEKPVPLPGDGEEREKREHVMKVECMRWGLLPSYTKSIPHGGDALRTINARDDSVLSGGGMWTPLLKKGKRCVVFAQGFYEWLKKSDGSRVAHFVGMLDEGNGRVDVNGKGRALMPMAGLYERCFIDEQEVYSFTIITTESNKQLNFLHDRMPVILPNSHAILSWLGTTSASSKEICSLLKPYDAGQLDCYPVPREVGKVGNDDESFILPVKSRKDGLMAAFGRAEKKNVNSESNAPLEQELKAVESERKRQLKDDENLARSLQQEEEKSVKKVKVENNEKESSSTKDAIKGKSTDKAAVSKKEEDSDSSSTKEGSLKKEDDDEHPAPSSRFSPEPWNPPKSPKRPNGGYTTETSPHLTYVRRGTASSGSTATTKLEEAAKGTKDIRTFFK